MRIAGMAAAVRAVIEAERDLAAELRKVAQRHGAEHDVFHIANRLAGLCDSRVVQLGEHTERYGNAVDDGDFAAFAGLVASARRHLGEVAAKSEHASALLLRDLRHLYVTAAECDIAWTILNQGAKACRDAALVEVVYACQQDVGRTLKWLESRIKETAPQVLTG